MNLMSKGTGGSLVGHKEFGVLGDVMDVVQAYV